MSTHHRAIASALTSAALLLTGCGGQTQASGTSKPSAAALAPVLAEVMADGGPQVVTYVLGSSGDPQGYARQRAALEAAGCLVTETAARAAYLAAAIAARKPEIAERRD